MKAQLIQAIDIAIKPSFLLMGLLSVISILSCLIVITLPISSVFKLLLLALIIISTAYYTLRDALRLLPCSWRRLEVSPSGQLKLTSKQGKQFTPHLAATSFIHPLMIILNTQPTSFKQRLFGSLPALILFANQEAQQQRRLRVWLRWWKHHSLN